MDALTAVLLADIATYATDQRHSVLTLHANGALDVETANALVKQCNRILENVAGVERRMMGGQV